ncbi:23S rRNA pseudouridine(955/2504/2580) synthase RluC [Methylosoma difficile]
MSIEEPSAAVKVTHVEITEEQSEQRLDNFLIARLKGVPKSHIYRIVRKGEVRVNKGRVDVKYRLAVGDIVRVPPVRVAERTEESYVSQGLKEALELGILFEDDAFMVINKPAGFAVHGGSGVSSGVIEGLRLIRPEARFLELVHRLDKDTSGCLIIAKKRSALRLLHEQFRDDRIQKTYLALLSGQWAKKQQVVNAPLLKNISQGGERMVVISPSGKTAETLFKRLQVYKAATLVEASPKTGRTHQIRVHAASLGHPIIGDDRYGFEDANKLFRQKGYKRMFLHAKTLKFQHPVSQAMLSISAPLPKQLDDLLKHEEPL